MDDIPVPVQLLRLNAWSIDKTLLICKTLSLAACIIGTAIYYSPLDPYIEIPCFGILVPTFIIGYLIIISSDFVVLFMYKEYVFLEICFAVIGAVGSLTCGIYQLYTWITWMLEDDHDPDSDYDLSEFALSMALIVNSLSMMAVAAYRLIQERARSSSNENQ